MTSRLRERERVRQGRQPQPSGCIMDSQSVKTTSVGGIWGYDEAKKLSGRNRHLLAGTLWVTLGLVLRAKVDAVDIQDRAAVPQVLARVKEGFWRLAHVWLDQGYTGSGKTWIEERLSWTVEVVQHPPTERGEWRYTRDETRKLQGTYVRFASERPKDYERLPETSEAMTYATMSRLMLKRLAAS